MTEPVVLVSENPVDRAGGVAELLERFPARVVEASFSDRALELVRTVPVDLIVFDVDQGGGATFEACRRMRPLTHAPIIVVSRVSHAAAEIEALDAGADDYVAKPLGGAEFIARVRAHLRRRDSVGDGVANRERIVTADGLLIDLAQRRVCRDDQEIRLTQTEWAILRTLVGRRGRPVSHEDIMKRYGDVRRIENARKSAYTSRRRKLERLRSHPRVIVTEPGFGYRLALVGADRPGP